MNQKNTNQETALEQVIRRNSDTVYRLAYSLVKTRQDAEDVYQEVFLRYIQKEPVFDNAEHEKAWFMRVTINLCKNFWKSAWVRRRSVYDKERYEENMGKECRMPETEDENMRIIETVKQLPEKYRIVIHLFYYEELSVEQITGITHTRASTVRTQLTRARRLLKELFKEEGDLDV